MVRVLSYSIIPGGLPLTFNLDLLLIKNFILAELVLKRQEAVNALVVRKIDFTVKHTHRMLIFSNYWYYLALKEISLSFHKFKPLFIISGHFLKYVLIIVSLLGLVIFPCHSFTLFEKDSLRQDVVKDFHLLF